VGKRVTYHHVISDSACFAETGSSRAVKMQQIRKSPFRKRSKTNEGILSLQEAKGMVVDV
jgi:hypothetical protein